MERSGCVAMRQCWTERRERTKPGPTGTDQLTTTKTNIPTQAVVANIGEQPPYGSISNATDDGILLLSSTFSSISGNLIQNCEDDAIDLSDPSYVTIEDNTLVHSKWGITV